jgi:hypothetical protein
MSRVRIYDLTNELTPGAIKILEVARRMGILSRLPHGFRPGGKLDTPDTPDKDKPQPRKPGDQDNH